jgi:hypothetical protein
VVKAGKRLTGSNPISDRAAATIEVAVAECPEAFCYDFRGLAHGGVAPPRAIAWKARISGLRIG